MTPEIAKQSTVHPLASISAGDVGLGERGLPKGVKILDPIFWDYYDNTTLLYDAIWSAEKQSIQIFFPKLFGFKETIRNAKWTLDGQPRKAGRLKQFRVYDSISIPCRNPADTLALITKDGPQNIPFRRVDADRYAGRNVLYSQNRDNDITWICDWVTAHQRNHGVDAVLLSNNNSETYSSEELRQALARIPGIVIADVLDVPFRYGPNPKMVTPVGDLKFLQRSLLNIVRARWLQKARAVLVSDIDELVVSHAGESIFDATTKATLKYTSFSGMWRYREPRTDKARHADHIYARGEPDPCANKYCVVPDSPLGRLSWGVHSLEGINRRIFPASKAFSFYHCLGISTSWKNARAEPPITNFHQDQTTMDFMQKTFSASASEDATS